MEEIVTQVCQQQISYMSENPEVWVMWGNILYMQGKLEEAEEKYKKALERNAYDGDALFGWGNVAYSQGRFDVAKEKYGLATTRSAEPSEVHYKFGKMLCHQGSYKRGIDQFEFAICTNPNSSKIYYAWGNALSALGKFPEAAEKYQKTIELDHGFSMAYNNLGNALASMKRYPEAIEQYYQAITIDPNLHVVYSNWDYLLHLEKIDKIPLNTNDQKFSYAYYQWANVLVSQEKYHEAIEKYERGAKINPDFELLYFSWGLALEKLGKTQEAMDLYHRKNTQKADYEDELKKNLAEKITVAMAMHPDDKDPNMSEKVKEIREAEIRLQKQISAKLELLRNLGVIDTDEYKANEEQKEISERVETKEYYYFMQREFNTIIATAFIVNGDRFKEKDDPVLAFLAWATDYIPKVGGIISYIIGRVNSKQITDTNKKYVRCINHFVNMTEPGQVIEYVARKMTLIRKQMLIREYRDAFLDCSLVNNKAAKKFLRSDNINTKAEERAFIDLATMLIECFLQELPIEYETINQKLPAVAQAVMVKMLECVERERSEGNPLLQKRNKKK